MNSVVFRRVFHRSFIALTLVGIMTFSVSGAAAAFKNIKVGDRALPLQLQDLGGQEHTLEKYRESKAVLLFFWATWSERSLKELADLTKFQEQYADKGLQILAVNVENQTMDDEDIAQIKSVLEENGVSFPVLIDKGLQTYNEWGVIATPTTAIISSEGVVAFDLSSYPSSAYLDMDEAIRKAVGLYVEEEKQEVAEPSYVPTREALLHLGLGKRHAEKDFMTKALPELQKAAVADSGWAEPHVYLAFVHFRMGDREKAMESIEKAYQLEPESTRTIWLQSYLLVSEEKVDEAIALLQGQGKTEEETGEPVSESPGSAPAMSAAGGEAAAPEPTAAAKRSGEDAAEESLDLSEVIALKDAGKAGEAASALEELLSGKLAEAGFTMKKKTMNAMEKMKLMMQKKQAQ